MATRAVARYVRMSPTKVRQVICLVRGRNAVESMSVLSCLNKRAAIPVGKAVKSAISNALNKNPSLNQAELYISKIEANDGPTWKRFRAAAMGRGVRIRKRTSHIIVELDVNNAKRG